MFACNLGVGGQMRNQSEHAVHCLGRWYCVIAHVRMRVATNESTHVPRPEVKFSGLIRWLHAEMTQVAFAFLDGMVMTAHGPIVSWLLQSPQSDHEHKNASTSPTSTDCTAPALPTFVVMRQRVRQEPGWQVLEIATGHDLLVRAPGPLSDILISISKPDHSVNPA